MTSTSITPNRNVTDTPIDFSNIDIDAALQRGRQMRSRAFTSMLKSLFSGRRAEREERTDGFSPDCAAPA